MWARAQNSSLPGALARAAALVLAGGLFPASGCGLRVAESPTQPIPCFHAMDCPPSDDPCVVSTCFEQQCAMVAAAQNTVVREQKAGDCRMQVCDGNGHVMEIDDEVDVPADDGNACTIAMCKESAGVHEPGPVGESCGEDGVCNGKGACGACLPEAERCEGNAVATCSEEGAWKTAACPEGRPICAGKACVGIRQIAAGGAHTCALFEDGSARCFGAAGVRRGAYGAPPVPGVVGAVELALGGAHACARRADGTALCWGHNAFGQVGDGTTDGPRPPTQVLGLAGATAIAAGAAHTCAIVGGGKVVCWGRGDRGQLGAKPPGPAGKPPATEVPSPLPASPGGRAPSAVAGLFGATKIALGGRHACALGPGGLVACWGEDESGELGSVRPPSSPAKPRPGPRPTPRLVSVKGIEGAIAIALGAAFGCVLLADGSVRCWGDNTAAQLGDGTTDARAESVVVKGVAGATAIALGAEHGCARTEGGAVTCWGKNDHGQLGDGSTEARLSPVLVPGLAGVRALSAGGAHTCVMLDGGAVRCWGGNGAGEVGDGTTSDRGAPTAVTW
ncbi:RCC1 domain-containing protein [Polyangium sorediatum]|uniref:BNR repeat domain protein n=1 Tax=Polyangium sorediatum TaxID=889274 RepID=A0ABT6NRE8_9BACT|nr:hypothetical protein [Polyangium sorediatum]MDI1430884.1 hypothetical protein [Polyangium sorediatum]